MKTVQGRLAGQAALLIKGMSGVQFEIKVITNNGAAQVAEVKTEFNPNC